MRKFNYYPVLIDGQPFNVEVRSERVQFLAAGSFRAIPETIAISFANLGGQSVILDGVFTILPNAADYNLGGDLFGRRSDEIDITFTGAGTTICIVTQDIFVRFVEIDER